MCGIILIFKLREIPSEHSGIGDPVAETAGDKGNVIVTPFLHREQ